MVTKKVKNPKPMKTLIAQMNAISRDVRLNPKGRILCALLGSWASDKVDEEERRLLKALIVAQYIAKGGIEFSDDALGLAPGGLAEPANGTKIERESAATVDEMLSYFMEGKDGSAQD